MLHHPADQRNKIPKVAEWNQQLLQKNLVAIEVVTRSSLYIQTIIRSRPVRLERSLYGNCRSQGLLAVEVESSYVCIIEGRREHQLICITFGYQILPTVLSPVDDLDLHNHRLRSLLGYRR
ncbi:hypothetical protein Pst134EA_015367 [Puccinia striiformis f. sp. tritici]|uniref:hypothetical protein n=1 Tax=Puccinia striiformis f. sp. tritici TaxID=168172 RepID=UPI002007B159|nr:hypothetical protein Pst134EA_015367 [Puccinia striiformis f. sp. tritici]KAH9463282.1 hypothetical protein Pst134EA_015367 [Puccinia striiformis f. sp. tritici]